MGSLPLHAPSGALEAFIVAAALAVVVTAFGRAVGWEFAAVAAVLAAAGFVVIGHPAVPVMLALAGLCAYAQSRRGHDLRQPAKPFLVQVCLAFGALGLYMIGRWLIESDLETAQANARRIVDFEQAIGLWFEPDLQEAFLGQERLITLINGIYSYMFLASVAAGLVWLYVADRANYRIFRNALGISVVLALVTIALLPVAPPRFLPEIGIIDTIAAAGRDRTYANDFAAMPSLHVGWMALLGFVLARSIGGWRGAAVGVVPGAVMFLAVIVTGNHYWIDGVIGIAFCIGPALAFAHEAAVGRALSRTGVVAAQSWTRLSVSRKAQFSTLTLGGLLLYMLVAQAVAPGFTNFWGYFVFQIAGVLTLILAGEVLLAKQGGLSWLTHGVAVVCCYADVLGTDGNLYARIDEYDKLTHFLGVAAVTSGAYDLMRYFGRSPESRVYSRDSRLLLSITVGVAVGLGWEVYEWAADKVFATKRVQGQWDTFNDVIFDTLGAVIIAWLLWRDDRPVTESERAPVPDEALEVHEADSTIGPGGAS